MKRRVLQNASICTQALVEPTVRLMEGEPGFDEALEGWLRQPHGPPTSDPEWRKGVYMHFVDLLGDGHS